LPVQGDRVSVGDYEFEVERVADRAIASTLARRVGYEQAGDDE
jgi:hypothetical protein